VIEDLTSNEQALVDATRAGHVLTCDDGTEIRAELIRELVLGRRGEPDPRGVRLANAQVVGTLDLAHVTATVGLTLTGCFIAERIILEAATLPWLVLQGSQLRGGIRASILRVSGDVATDVRGEGRCPTTMERSRPTGCTPCRSRLRDRAVRRSFRRSAVRSRLDWLGVAHYEWWSGRALITRL
jgi:hypothetical protein